jgi:hypothetical protein
MNELHQFLGRYLHDSLAGFCLAGYATQEERSEKLLELVEKKARGESLNAHDTQVAQIEELRDVYPDVKANAMDKYKATSVFKPEENRAIDESGVFPVLTDADAQILYGGRFGKYVLTQLTYGRRGVGTSCLGWCLNEKRGRSER